MDHRVILASQEVQRILGQLVTLVRQGVQGLLVIRGQQELQQILGRQVILVQQDRQGLLVPWDLHQILGRLGQLVILDRLDPLVSQDLRVQRGQQVLQVLQALLPL